MEIHLSTKTQKQTVRIYGNKLWLNLCEAHIQFKLQAYTHTWAHLPYIPVLKSVHRTATVSSFDVRKKVRIELQTVAVLWTLFKTAIYGRCAQVCWRKAEKIESDVPLVADRLIWT